MWAILFVLSALAQDCPNPIWSANRAEEDVLDFYLDSASEEVSGAVEAFACNGPANPKVVARLLNASGVVSFLQADVLSAQLAFATAKGIAPDVWLQDYGEEPAGLRKTASSQETGTLELSGTGRRTTVWVDGQQQDSELVLPAGPHLVQVGARGEEIHFASWVTITAGEITSLRVPQPFEDGNGADDRHKVVEDELDASGETELVEGMVGAPGGIEAIELPRRRRGALVSGIVLVGVGSALGTMTWALNRDDTTPVSLTYENGMKAANAAGWGLAGAGLVVGVIGGFSGKKTNVISSSPHGLLIRGRF